MDHSRLTPVLLGAAQTYTSRVGFRTDKHRKKVSMQGRMVTILWWLPHRERHGVMHVGVWWRLILVEGCRCSSLFRMGQASGKLGKRIHPPYRSIFTYSSNKYVSTYARHPPNTMRLGIPSLLDGSLGTATSRLSNQPIASTRHCGRPNDSQRFNIRRQCNQATHYLSARVERKTHLDVFK
jgi:hypothetical protein